MCGGSAVVRGAICKAGGLASTGPGGGDDGAAGSFRMDPSPTPQRGWLHCTGVYLSKS